eukprot:10476786-Alexandrium_andersonii.AAC.1
MCIRDRVKVGSGLKIQPEGATVPALPTGQMARSAAPNRRKSENPHCCTARPKKRRAKRGTSCAWTCGKGVSDVRRFGARRKFFLVATR